MAVETLLVEEGVNKSQFRQSRLHVGVAHEELPQQAGPVILNHDCDRSLVDGEVTLRIPIVRFTESIVEAERSEHFVAHIIEVAHHLHGVFRCIDDGR